MIIAILPQSLDWYPSIYYWLKVQLKIVIIT